MKLPDRHWVSASVFTTALVLLVAVAVANVNLPFLIVLLTTVFGSCVLIHVLFPASRFLAIAFGNFLALYACTFVVIFEGFYTGVTKWFAEAGFVLPIAAILFGAVWQRDEIRGDLADDRAAREPRFARIHLCVIPLIVIGVISAQLSKLDLGQTTLDAIYISAMVAVGAVVLALTRRVFTFLVGTGLLFEGLFARLSHLAAPVFAFFTFYSLIVIVYACIYRIVDVYTATSHFLVGGETRAIGFTESLYFSIITLSTVGYGDITPLTNLVRTIVAVQVLSGVLLLLFGVSEILRFARESGGEDDENE